MSAPDPRVLFAAERTLMAWQRTAIALIAFGFLIERSGILLKLLSNAQTPGHLLTVLVGLVFLALGIFVAIYSAKEYRKVLASIAQADYPPGYTARWGIVINLTVALLGSALALSLLWSA